MTDERPLLERLRAHAIMGQAPEWELAWLHAHGTMRRLKAGDFMVRAGHDVEALYAILSGCLTIHVEKAYGRRKIMEWRAGDVTGALPFSRMGASPGDSVAEEDTDFYLLPKEHVPAMIHACPETTAILVHVLVDRARRFTSSDLQDRKALALAKLAAGLSHELNNPASAVMRGAKSMSDALEAGRAAVRALAILGFTQEEFSVIDGVKALVSSPAAKGWSPLERADREEALVEWLEGLGADPEGASILADIPIALDELRTLVGELSPEKQGAALTWLTCWLTASRVSKGVQEGAARIFDLVSAVQGLTHMDRALRPELLDVRSGIEQSLALVSEKARESGVSLATDFAEELPSVEGVAGELAQAWHALLDNAVDAAGEGGAVRVVVGGADGWLTVEIHDDGPGIPEEIRDRIFDPFFTTKPVGQGIGLGLELVRRVVDQHRGEIDVASAPGHTFFRVRLRTMTRRS